MWLRGRLRPQGRVGSGACVMSMEWRRRSRRKVRRWCWGGVILVVDGANKVVGARKLTSDKARNLSGLAPLLEAASVPRAAVAASS